MHQYNSQACDARFCDIFQVFTELCFIQWLPYLYLRVEERAKKLVLRECTLTNLYTLNNPTIL